MTNYHFLSNTNRYKESGLTLVEMLVVSLLLALMGSIIYGTLNGISLSKEAIESERSISRTAHFVLKRLSKELRSSVKEPLYIESKKKTLNTITRNKYFMGEKNKKTDTKTHGDFIQFVSASGSGTTYGSISNYGHIQIKYSLKKSKDDNSKEPSYVLLREEIPANVENKDIIKKRKIIFPVADNILSLNFRYLTNNNKWQTSWTSKDRDLPKAVEITLKIKGKDGRKNLYRTSVTLPSKEPTRKFQNFSNYATTIQSLSR